MLIFDEFNRTIILESIHVPLTSSFMYVLDLDEKDFFLNQIEVLEEIVSKRAYEVEIDGFKFVLPTHWAVLIADEETSVVDIVEVKDLIGKDFSVFVYGHHKFFPSLCKVNVVNCFTNYTTIAPSLHKRRMLCHPISPDTWINICPTDSYAKELKNATIGDFI